MEIIVILLSCYMLLYVGFISYLIFGFSAVKHNDAATGPAASFSIVVPFRNEGANLPRLLESIAALDYPTALFEIIFIDDFSDDDSVSMINQWRMSNGLLHTTVLENLRLSGSPKKDAIMRAVPIIENKWIVTTDADCRLHPQWLKAINDFVANTHYEMVAGPVQYDGNNSFLHHFQRMDFLSLQGATIGSFGLGKAFMCNGANFAFTKKLFIALDGYKGNSQIASGDDVFLLQKAMTRFPKQVGYLKSRLAMVTTKPADSWKTLFNQRVRWAAKTSSYQSEFGSDLAIAVFFGNLVIVVSVILSFIGIVSWEFALAIFILKLLVDTTLLIRANRFFNGGKLFFPLPAAMLYPFFCVAVALYAALGTYTWKGRSYRS